MQPYLGLRPSSDLSVYVDSRSYGMTGPTKNVRFPRATPGGGGAISKSEDGTKCVVTGKESLRIMYVSDGSRSYPGHKSSVGRGGYRIDASRNLWGGSGLKIDSASTDVAWGHGAFKNKILTSARNGELIMWDINKAGPNKYERRSKDHPRSINAVSVSHIVYYYCITGSADGDMRVWDLRDMTRSVVKVHHPTSVRSLAFSPSHWQPLHTIVGLDNGSIYRWDLKMGQRGLLDRLPVAHTASVTSLDWYNRDLQAPASSTTSDPASNGMGWFVSGGLDRCVKVWDLTAQGGIRIPSKPTYTLHPSFPVRRVVWRPSHECELAVVSNAEFSSGSNPDLGQNNSVGTGGGESEKHSADSKSLVGGDAVEIWDVRRSWIPKWSVTGSAIEGGVTDLTFSTPDTIWTQSSSGTFAQIDLRNCIKPLDAITTTTATWESSGSLTFATDTETEWQVPYDDIPADRRVLADKRRIKVKALGDSCYVPVSQDVGTFNSKSANDVEAFNRLARGYIIIGEDRPTICAVNARVAFHARREELAQTWLLLGASLADLIPTTPAIFSPTEARPVQPTPQAVTSPAVPSNLYTFPTSASTASQLRKASPNHTSVVTPRSASTSTSRKITPASSNASSPRQMPIALPAPSTTPRRPSFFTGPRNVDSDFSRRPSISMLRRPSISVPGSHSLSPADKTNLRHVGEGALDDSDSSSAEESDGELDARCLSGGEDSGLQQLVSPGFLPLRNAPVPSPLSRVAGKHQWTEDEGEGQDRSEDGDDSLSPSPGSTDSDFPEPTIFRKRKASKSASRPTRRHSSLMHSRSRSVASLAAPPTPSLSREDSYSSIRTVLAIEAPVQEGGSGLRQEETIRDIRIVSQGRRGSELVTNQSGAVNNPQSDEIDPEDLTERHVKIVGDDEKRLRNLAWTALREALEKYADEGDIQMCAMLSIIAPSELEISERRASRFLESYIDLLTRRRLHACSAYLRKYCRLDDIRTTTLIDTAIYTSCGRCKKAMVPGSSHILGQLVKGGYSYCSTCKTSTITCAICRLPVRAMLFQCSVCCHGGHQACYQEYYLRKPMVDLPEPVMHTATTRLGSAKKGSSSGSTDDDIASTISTINSTTDSAETSPQQTTHPGRIAGHPCAAGCGHFCWVASVEP
ncbi:WD repeat-containing protein 24 [Termitomyces sp. T112]|nr:WD repeat-containing protein 24 [Termitomyces sp. T112]